MICRIWAISQKNNCISADRIYGKESGSLFCCISGCCFWRLTKGTITVIIVQSDQKGMFCSIHKPFAPVVKLADTLDLGSNAARRAGSNPVRCILYNTTNLILRRESGSFLLFRCKKNTRLHPNQSGLGEREWNEKIIITDLPAGIPSFRSDITNIFENRSFFASAYAESHAYHVVCCVNGDPPRLPDAQYLCFIPLIRLHPR